MNFITCLCFCITPTLACDKGIAGKRQNVSYFIQKAFRISESLSIALLIMVYRNKNLFFHKLKFLDLRILSGCSQYINSRR